MDLAELSERLVPFCREHLGDDATVSGVETMPGHAGFSFGFTATSKGESRSYVLRVPPPNVRRVGTADVIRQARVVHALRDTDVPVVNVIWSGEDERWFGSPYFVVNKLEGDVLRSDWGWEMPAEEMRPVAFRAMRALADTAPAGLAGVRARRRSASGAGAGRDALGPFLRALRRHGPGGARAGRARPPA